MPQRSDARLAELIATQVLNRFSPASVLDIGCGDGVVGDHLPQNCKYRGLDIVDACIYEQRHENPNVHYVESDQIPEAITNESPWDTILLLDVIEHTRRFTPLFELALENASQRVIVSLPNELFILDRLRMLRGHELNAHSLDLVDQPEGFKHQFIVNVDKARAILKRSAERLNFRLDEEIRRPLKPKQHLLRPLAWLTRQATSEQLWSMGSIFIFQKKHL